jgi:hypothetical protein
MLPKRAPIPGTNLFLSDVGPTETPVKKSYEFALRAFFYDFCIPETNGKLSRGFLSGLEAMAYRLGPESNLVKACQAVSFFSHAKPLNRPHMHERAERLHQELLGSLARAIEVPTLVASLETRYIALLLGLYEVFCLVGPTASLLLICLQIDISSQQCRSSLTRCSCKGPFRTLEDRNFAVGFATHYTGWE